MNSWRDAGRQRPQPPGLALQLVNPCCPALWPEWRRGGSTWPHPPAVAGDGASDSQVLVLMQTVVEAGNVAYATKMVQHHSSMS